MQIKVQSNSEDLCDSFIYHCLGVTGLLIYALVWALICQIYSSIIISGVFIWSLITECQEVRITLKLHYYFHRYFAFKPKQSLKRDGFSTTITLCVKSNLKNQTKCRKQWLTDLEKTHIRLTWEKEETTEPQHSPVHFLEEVLMQQQRVKHSSWVEEAGLRIQVNLRWG